MKMTRRVLMFVAALALVATGCGAGESNQSSLVARPLAYSLTGEVELAYDVAMDMQMTTKFGDTFRALDPSMPSSMDMTMEFEFDSLYRVTNGEEPGTYRVAMQVDDMRLGSGRMQMGGESFDFDDLPQGELDAVLDSQVAEVAYIIDEQGQIISMEIAGRAIDVGGIMGGTAAAGGNLGQMFGPELPPGEVEIGDTWTTTSEEALPGMDPIVTEQTHTIIRQEPRRGYDTWVIRTESSTGAYTITWDDLVAMAEQLGGLSEIGVDESMPPAFEMSMRSAPTGATMITWFDPERGVTVAQDVTTNIAMTMEMAGLPNTQGRAITMDVDGYTHSLMELQR
jgi:hypothetical protein